jgi:hypothetical protein
MVRRAAEEFGFHRGHHADGPLVALRLTLGRELRWVSLAEVKSIAAAFGQAATHASQPVQAAASNAVSAASFGIRIALASGALPVGALMKLALVVEGLIILGEHLQAGQLYPLVCELVGIGAVALWAIPASRR